MLPVQGVIIALRTFHELRVPTWHTLVSFAESEIVAVD